MELQLRLNTALVPTLIVQYGINPVARELYAHSPLRAPRLYNVRFQ